jgi:hypothetical protein
MCRLVQFIRRFVTTECQRRQNLWHYLHVMRRQLNHVLAHNLFMMWRPPAEDFDPPRIQYKNNDAFGDLCDMRHSLYTGHEAEFDAALFYFSVDSSCPHACSSDIRVGKCTQITDRQRAGFDKFLFFVLHFKQLQVAIRLHIRRASV